eukprot:CAMPEP_0204211086 /NCGR_PEP_ID=MMETSP0361-20130328/74386_1 /ASSEMBLY_ACC=CAM_ASM_000343 /TAXON_ID=268821 /ORGANISM="Scrippsiella Hangoei, Strain SHTV-5" /LENGTH=66 /DNA_ID=CAMNT_0051175309 /DNA_START=74 /DNA_END=271 /DNA_ORIENTATION=+
MAMQRRTHAGRQSSFLFLAVACWLAAPVSRCFLPSPGAATGLAPAPGRLAPSAGAAAAGVGLGAWL